MKHGARMAMLVACGRERERPQPHKDMKTWVECLINTDGTTGAHWTPEQVEPFRKAHAGCGAEEFWAAMNMMYSDYCIVAKQFAADKPEFYAAMAAAFLKDPDGGEHRMKRYMEM